MIYFNNIHAFWQGEGVGNLTQNRRDKEERINEFVAKILEQFPPKEK
ncbi:DUF4136 domain-containing protein [Flavobacterium sp. I-STPA6A]